MAAPPCMSDDGNQAAFVGTFMQNGDSVALCDEHLAGFAASLVCSMFGVPADELQALIDKHEGDEPPDPAGAAAEHAAPLSEPRPPTSDIDPTAGDSGPSGEVPASEPAPAAEAPPPADPDATQAAA